MMNKIGGFFIPIILGLIFAGQLYNLMLQNTDIFLYYSVEAINKTVKPGEPVHVQYDFIRKRVCRSELNVFAVRISDQEVVWRYSVIGGALPTGRSKVKNAYTVPTLPDGNYVLNIYIFSQCADGFHTDLAPSVEFTVKTP